MENKAIVNNAAVENFIDKINNLNNIAKEAERYQENESRSVLARATLPQYKAVLKRLALRWHGIRSMTVDSLNAEDLSILDKLIIKKAKSWNILLKTMVGLLGVGYISFLYYYLSIISTIETGSILSGILLGCALYGWMAPILTYVLMTESDVYQFISCRKICFPEENKNEHTGIFGL